MTMLEKSAMIACLIIALYSLATSAPQCRVAGDAGCRLAMSQLIDAALAAQAAGR